MARNKYYYYDHGKCTFVEVEATRKAMYANGAVAVVLALVLAGILAWIMDAQLIGTPQEMALKAENEALQEQIAEVESRLQTYTEELEELEETDQQLYRTLLQADPISEDLRQVGVGGSDPYMEFSRFGSQTSSLLRSTSESLDELERRINLQNASFRELSGMAEQYQLELAELPALLPADGPVVSGFGMRRHPILGGQRMHAGIDVLLNEGSPIIAPGDGIVREVSQTPGYGHYIEIEHPAIGYKTRYAHLSEVASHIRPGYEVERGERIARSGNTGRSTGPHLHYEVRDADDRAVNPLYFVAPSMTPEEYRRLLRQAEESGASLD